MALQKTPKVLEVLVANVPSEFVSIVQSWQGFRNWGFRGQGDARWSMKPSLARHIEVSKVHEQAWELQETRIQRIFRRKSHLFLDDRPDNISAAAELGIHAILFQTPAGAAMHLATGYGLTV